MIYETLKKRVKYTIGKEKVNNLKSELKRAEVSMINIGNAAT